MNNKTKYKEALSGVHHSDDLVERIMDMTVDKKQFNKGIFVKRLASATLALAILVGSGFGINSLVGKNGKNEPLPSGYSVGGLMTVMAKDELTGSASTDMGYRIYRVDITGMSDKEIEQAKLDLAKLWLCGGDEKGLAEAEAMNDFDKATLDDTLKNNMHINGNVLYATERGAEEDAITLCGIDDPQTVKEIRVTNTGDFGCPVISAEDLYYTEQADGTFHFSSANVDTSKTCIEGHDISLSGDRYYQCRRIENPKAVAYGTDSLDKNSEFYGVELATGKIFYIDYEFTDDFYNELGKNPAYDFAKYYDEITVTVEFKDGKTAENKLAVKLDDNGNTYLQLLNYSFD